VDEVPTSILNKLELRDAAVEESKAWRNLLPPEPWQPVVAGKPGKFAELAKTQLEAGVSSMPAAVINVRKAHQAIRPVPAVGILERIIFRALTDLVLQHIPLVRRSVSDYRSFIAGPITHAFNGRSSFRLSDAKAGYVIEADIAGFYQYIDHSILLNELELRTGKISESRLLTQFLNEVQTKTFGLPQLLDPSDRLSDIYVEKIERDLIRRDFKVWRYNDDFRFAIDKYGRAQEVTEQLGNSAHDMGLLLNEAKTRIVKFSTYFWRYFADDDSMTPETEVRPEDMQIVTEYGEVEDDEELLKRATEILDQLELPDGDKRAIRLPRLKSDHVRKVRHMFRLLAKVKSDAGLPHVSDTLRYAPELTPVVCNYLVRLHDADCDVSRVWDDVVTYTGGFNSWQRAWITYVARVCSYVDIPARQAWIETQLKGSEGQLLHAEASLALAKVNGVSFSELDIWIRTQPEAFTPWYVLAINELPNVEAKKTRALKDSSRLFQLLLER
jgi:hypothetical protein